MLALLKSGEAVWLTLGSREIGFHSGKYDFDVSGYVYTCAYILCLGSETADFCLFLKEIVSFPVLAFSWDVLCVALVLTKYSLLGTAILNIEKETFQ